LIDLTTDRATLARFVRELVADTRAHSHARPDLDKWSDDDVEAARLGWCTRIIDEYRSVAMFSELLRLLAEVEAPFATLCAVQRLVGDELRHTWQCAEVVSWLGGMDDLAIDLDDLGPAPSDDPPAARAIEIVAREIVVAETESIRALRAFRDATKEPAIRGVLEALLFDEVRHAAAGREILPILVKTLPRADIEALVTRLPGVMADDRKNLRALYAANATGGPGRKLGVSLTLADLDAA
jgi:hypothetical protein